MARRASRWAIGITLIVVLWPFAFGMPEAGENTTLPPLAEQVVYGLSIAFVFAVTFAGAYAVQWSRRRRSGGEHSDS